MTPEERDRLTRVEAASETLAQDVSEMKDDVKAIRDTLMQAKGGWRTLLMVGGAAGAVGAAIAQLLPFLPLKP